MKPTRCDQCICFRQRDTAGAYEYLAELKEKLENLKGPFAWLFRGDLKESIHTQKNSRIYELENYGYCHLYPKKKYVSINHFCNQGIAKPYRKKETENED